MKRYELEHLMRAAVSGGTRPRDFQVRRGALRTTLQGLTFSAPLIDADVMRRVARVVD